MSNLVVGVEATFSVRGQTVHQFSSSAGKDSQSAAASPTIGQKGPVEGTDKYDYRYTGTHDHGTLPALKTGGLHGEVVKALLGAKEDSDAFLTGLINQELAQEPVETQTVNHKNPCPKEQSKGAAAAVLGDRPRDAMEPEPMEQEGSDDKPGAVHPPIPPPSSATQPAKRPRS